MNLNNKIQSDLLKKHQGILEVLETAIIVINDQKVEFFNSRFKELLNRLALNDDFKHPQELSEKILNFKFLSESHFIKIQKNDKSSISCSNLDNFTDQMSSNRRHNIRKMFSLKELIEKSEDYVNEKIFEINIKNDAQNGGGEK